MPKQTRRWNPGDAANAFVRVILSDSGAMVGGLTETEWRTTVDWFDGRCAYTDDVLAEDQLDRDHAIPMNRTHCGLHLFGNVVPATREVNRRKASKHYRDFIEDRNRLERIEGFIRSSGYWERVSVFGDLQGYCGAQYRAVDALCRVNRQYLKSLLPVALERDDDAPGEPPEEVRHASEEDVFRDSSRTRHRRPREPLGSTWRRCASDTALHSSTPRQRAQGCWSTHRTAPPQTRCERSTGGSRRR